MIWYYRSKDGTARMKMKTSGYNSITFAEMIPIITLDKNKWTPCSFWQYYFPTWFPLTQQQKEVTNAPSSDKADADDHQTHDPDFAVG